MQNYYEKLLEYWEEGDVEEAIRCYEQWVKAGLLSQEEIEELDKRLSDWSHVVRQEALNRLLVRKGEFTEEEFLEMVKTVDREIRAKVRFKDKKEFWIKA